MSALAQTFAATSASALASRKSSSFNARSSLMTSSTTTSSSSSSRGARLQTFARVDGGVGVFGNKAGMTQIFTDDGLCVPVTVIAVKDGNYVSAVKTAETDGYNAVQVAYDAVAEHKITKPEVGHLAKAGVKPMRHVEEFRLAAPVDGITVGQKLSIPEMFKEGDYVDVRGTSIGKGFQGSVKRHGFARGLMTHGSKSHRQHGSVGAGTYPGRIFPGKKMHGQMGNETTTIKQLKIMRVEDDCIIIRGNVPGKKGNLIRVAPAKIVGKNC